ncbi:MAG: aminotransferase class I/II-fold pyridoxal phosphate-dependent enzyme [Epulopiscium sp.]|nr:aminotransferase class I/II-fold pyridoxal phosphate-dependent enzyme [Candidatus Epulonipiscium sp.]
MKKEMIATKVRELPPSGIRKFFDVANEMKDVISLGVGEPDFDTPWHIREEGIYSLEKGKTIYTSNSGLMELRCEISTYLSRRFNITYNPNTQILVTVGASEAIDLALRALLNPGDEVLIPEPSYVSYKPCAIMAGGNPVVITTKAENEFRLTPEQLEEHITDKTKVLILPYPNNPTGGIMEKSDLEKIAEVLRKRDILVISDEIYAELTYDKEHVSIAMLPGMYENTLVINGFSKAYAMTGWRMGYAAGPKDLIAEMTKIHQYAIMCAPTISQYAGIEALKNGDNDVAQMKASFNRRRKIMVNGFRNMGMDCFEPLGAFYVFPSIQKTGLTAEEFCTKLLYEQKVAVVPGTAFGESGEGFIRCSYAYSIENIKEALKRIELFMQQYQ